MEHKKGPSYSSKSKLFFPLVYIAAPLKLSGEKWIH